ncbi:MAG: HypC/HybG/HupF family hydrogenase formation chaperone [Phycisphaeraceae bacterium]
MCLAVPARVISREGDTATVDLHGNRLNISVVLTPDAQVGDHVLLHAGFAIQRLDPRAAEQTFALLEEIDNASSSKPRQSESFPGASAALGSEGGAP